MWPAARRRYCWLVVAVGGAAAISIPIATSSGEGLERHLPRTALLTTHTQLGDELLVYVAGMVVVLTGLMVSHRRADAPRGAGTTAAPGRLTGPLRIVAAHWPC